MIPMKDLELKISQRKAEAARFQTRTGTTKLWLAK